MPVRNTILCLAAITLFTACNINKSEDAMKLSNHVTVVNDSLQYFGKQWSDEFQIAISTRDFAGLPEKRTDIQDFIERKIIDINTLKDIGGSEELREAELKLLEFDKDSVLPYLASFEPFDAQTPEQQLMAEYKTLMEKFRGEEQRLDKVYKLRDDYADANDFPKPTSNAVKLKK